MKGVSPIVPGANHSGIACCEDGPGSPESGADTFRGRHQVRGGSNWAPWARLGIVLVLFLGYIGWLRPAGMFGYFHDDTLYFSSARAIAAGQGYIIPSLPGTPRQTKYPVLYSWLLSWIWKWFPVFPANVMPAIWLTALFGCWALTAAFQFLRKIGGIGDWAALAMVAVIAFCPHFIFPNISVLSDIPFVALALTAIVLADPAVGPGGRLSAAGLAGLLAGLSVDMRTLGVAAVAGIFLLAVGRREYRRGLVFLSAAAPFVAYAAWPALTGIRTPPGAGVLDPSDPAWNQTWLYYTSYLANWKASVPNMGIFLQMIKSSGLLLLISPVQYLLGPIYEPWSPGGMAVYASLTMVLIAGIVRMIRTQGWRPIHPILLIYSAILLVWPYPQMYRFLLLFMPLFFAAFYIEIKRLVRAMAANLKSGLPLAKKLPAIGLSAALLVIGGVAVWNYARSGRVALQDRIDRRTAILGEKQQAYEWIRRNTGENTKILAFEDVMVYLYTGRQAMRPISFLPSCCVTSEISILQADLSRIFNVSRHIHASYWLMSDDYLDDEGSIPLIHAKMIEVQSQLPVVFRSREGHVQIYDLSKIVESAPPESQTNSLSCVSSKPCRSGD
jgi:hypothetical protein